MTQEAELQNKTGSKDRIRQKYHMFSINVNYYLRILRSCFSTCCSLGGQKPWPDRGAASAAEVTPQSGLVARRYNLSGLMFLSSQQDFHEYMQHSPTAQEEYCLQLLRGPTASSSKSWSPLFILFNILHNINEWYLVYTLIFELYWTLLNR